jgi:hypothetical protein
MMSVPAVLFVLSLGLLAQALVQLPEGRGDKTGKAQHLAKASASAQYLVPLPEGRQNETRKVKDLTNASTSTPSCLGKN